MSEERFESLQDKKIAIKFLLDYIDKQVQHYEDLTEDQRELLVAVQTMVDPLIDIAYPQENSITEVKAKKHSKKKSKSNKVPTKKCRKPGRVTS